MNILKRQLVIGTALAAALMASAPGAATAADAPAARAVQFDIPAGSLGAAIAQLGRDAGVMIAFDPAVVRNQRTSGLHGRYTASAGLARLLQGVGLRAAPDGAGGFTIVTARTSAPPVRRAAAAPQQDAVVAEELLVTGVRAVTATKTDTPVLETPQAISVITSAEFRTATRSTCKRPCAIPPASPRRATAPTWSPTASMCAASRPPTSSTE